MLETREPLLKKVYFENCPGCKVDQMKEASTGIPYREFLYVWMVVLCTALPIASLFPYLYFMIRDLHVAKTEVDIGFYAGFVGASFYMGRALTSLVWGIIADRYGRKPVIVIGIVAVIIFNTMFGLSTSYWMALTSRFLLGALNGVLGPIRAYSVEVSPDEHQPLAISLVSTAWGIGLIIGPALGGYFAQPAEKYPNIFSQDSFFGRFPYALPSFIISIFGVCVLISCVWLPETLHFHHEENVGGKTVETVEAFPREEKNGANEKGESAPEKILFKNWPLMSSIILYCIFSFHDMAYTEIFSLWAVSDKSYGGLSFTSTDVGQVLTISGFSLLVFQLIFYPPVARILGPITSTRVAAIIAIPVLAAYPFMTNLSGVTLTVVVSVASLLKNISSVIVITGMFILQNNSVTQDQRGAANGLSMTFMSIFKAIAPASAGIIFSWAQKRQTAHFLPGDQIVFFGLNIVELIGLVMTFRPFLVPPPTE